MAVEKQTPTTKSTSLFGGCRPYVWSLLSKKTFTVKLRACAEALVEKWALLPHSYAKRKEFSAVLKFSSPAIAIEQMLIEHRERKGV